ncbi:ATP-dependent DNA helicase [Trichonephila clavipes]|uniref:ATP-dependent DNA helicase n=1 Tax=Trichonephila clavipes TaxID=2585209 RepID=A0A8X6S000_TRICX|nr:ATP-dependent DNA helicase [Trichonephila clavipes]
MTLRSSVRYARNKIVDAVAIAKSITHQVRNADFLCVELATSVHMMAAIGCDNTHKYQRKQTLPVTAQSTPADEINASLKHSALWRHVKTLKLTTNMRVQLQNDQSAEIFSHQLMDIGNRKVPADLSSWKISLTHNFCNLVASKGKLVETVFPDIQTNFKNPNWLSEHAILPAKNKGVYQLNNIIQSRIQNETVTYKSVDTVVEVDEAVNYPTEFFNSLDECHPTYCS